MRVRVSLVLLLSVVALVPKPVSADTPRQISFAGQMGWEKWSETPALINPSPTIDPWSRTVDVTGKASGWHLVAGNQFHDGMYLNPTGPGINQNDNLHPTACTMMPETQGTSYVKGVSCGLDFHLGSSSCTGDLRGNGYLSGSYAYPKYPTYSGDISIESAYGEFLPTGNFWIFDGMTGGRSFHGWLAWYASSLDFWILESSVFTGCGTAKVDDQGNVSAYDTSSFCSYSACENPFYLYVVGQITIGV